MNRILVALDSSVAADLVLSQAVELARASGAKLRLLRVVPDAVEPPAPNLVAPMGDANALIARAESDLQFRQEAVPTELRDDVMVELGQPWESICRAARLYKADLVVIGAHHYGIVDRVLGTTAAKVVNHIDRPVLVVRPEAKAEETGKAKPDVGTRASAAALLRAEHARLEGVYAALLLAYRAGDWPDVRAQWNIFEPALRAHMDLEEKSVFPAFREVNPTEASALLAEHDALRKLLEPWGVGIELHAVTHVDAEELVRRLRDHGAREERILYPWIEASSVVKKPSPTASPRSERAVR